MTQPHHHVFNALESLFHRKVPILPLIPVLIDKGVISPDQKEWFDESNGIKVLTGYLRSRDYGTFLLFMESVFEAGASSGVNIDFILMKSVKDVVDDFDKRFQTSHAQSIEEIVQKYTRKKDVEYAQATDQELSESMKRLSLNELGLPFLSDEPETFSFDKNGGTYHHSKFDITIKAPPGVCKDETITFSLAVCACGPFAIAKECKVVTGFICVETSSTLLKPVRVCMQHCLKMVKYEKNHSIIILRSDYQQTSSGEYIFEPYWGFEIGGNNQKEKRQIVRPEISPDTPHLWFEIDKFCILCGVVSTTETATSTKQATSSPGPDPSLQENIPNDQHRNPVTIPLSEIGKTPSLEEYGTIERSGSFASPTPATSSAAMLTTPARFEIESKRGHINTERRATTKRRLSSSSSVESKTKRPPCYVEYTILFVHIKSTFIHKFYLFVCQNCLTSIQVCKEQVAMDLGDDLTTNQWKLDIQSGEFIQPQLEVFCDIEQETQLWKWHATRTPMLYNTSFINESDVHITQRSCSSGDLKNLLGNGLYPPRIVFEVYPKSRFLLADFARCSFKIKGFEFSPTTSDAYFSVLLVPKMSISPDSPQYRKTSSTSKAEEVFRNNFGDLRMTLSTLEALKVCTYLYSEWVIEEEEFLNVLHDQSAERKNILLKCVLKKIKGNPNNIHKVYTALEENTELAYFVSKMKKEYYEP